MHRDLPEVYLAGPRAKPERAPPISQRASKPLLRPISFAVLLLTASAGAAALVISGAPAKLLGLAPASQSEAIALREAPAFLARSTLMALHDANVTGNYGVFRALASPGFQTLNPPDALAQIFAGLRREQVDLSVAAVAPPTWDVPSVITADRLYRLRGTYNTGRHAVRFALSYVSVDEQWRLIEISVAAEPAASRNADAAAAIRP